MDANGATLFLLVAFLVGATVLAGLLWLGWEGGNSWEN